METLFAILAGSCSVALLVLAVLFIVKWIRKKPKKWVGLSALFCVIGIIAFSILGSTINLANMTPEERAVYESRIEQKAAERRAEKEAKAAEKEAARLAKAQAEADRMAEEQRVADENAEEKTVITDSGFEQEKDDLFYTISDSTLGKVPDVDTTMVEVLVSNGYTVEQASAIQQILNTIGITSIEIQAMTGTADELNAVVCYPNGYTDYDRRFFFTTDNGILFYAGFSGEDLYDTELGGYIKSYNDVHIPETEVDLNTFTELQILAEKDVKACLSHPSSANFKYLSWRIGRSDDKYKIIGEVSASNSFGVEDDLHFAAWYAANGSSFTLEGIEIDGARVK